MYSDLDEYLLELILMDTIAVVGGRCDPGAEQVIQRYLPAGLYDRIMARYDALSEYWPDDDPNLLAPWLRRAAARDSRWKRRMIVRFLCIMRATGPVGPAEWAEVAALAAAMDAGRECRQVFSYYLTPPHPRNSLHAQTRNTIRNVAV